MLHVGVPLLIAVAHQDLTPGFDGFPASLLVLSRSFVFISSVGIAFVATVLISLLPEGNATAMWVGCCGAVSARVGSQPPATPCPELWGMAEGSRQRWKWPGLVFTLQNALGQKCFHKDLLMHGKEMLQHDFFFNGLRVKDNKIKKRLQLIPALML